MPWKYSHKMFCEAIKEIVPEKKDEINKLITKHSLFFKAVKDSPNIKFCAQSDGNITIHTQSLTRFWAHTYAYFVLYDCKQNVGWQNKIDFENDKAATEAANLLKWAVNLDVNKLDTHVQFDMNASYPGVSIKPFEVIDGNPISVCARDITFFAIGFILLHEIAHLELTHCPDHDLDTGIAIQQEYQADMWAAHFVMDRIDNYLSEEYPGDLTAYENVFKKRMLSITACNNWLVKTECYNGISQSKSHPPMFERLSKIIDEFISDDNDSSWAMTVLVLSLHLQQSHPELITHRKFDTYKECSQFYMDCISNNFR